MKGVMNLAKQEAVITTFGDEVTVKVIQVKGEGHDDLVLTSTRLDREDMGIGDANDFLRPTAAGGKPAQSS